MPTSSVEEAVEVGNVWLMISGAASAVVVAALLSLRSAVHRLKRRGSWGSSRLLRFTLRSAQIVSLLVLFAIPAGCAAGWYYGYPDISLSPDRSVSPFFEDVSTEHVVARLKNDSYKCSAIGGYTQQSCIWKSGSESIEVILFGQTSERIERIVVRAATNRQDSDEWLRLAVSYLRSERARSEALAWANRNIHHSAVTTIGGYRLLLFGRRTLPALSIESPGQHNRATIEDLLPPKPLLARQASFLARTYAPILRFGEGEDFYPADIRVYGTFTNICQAELRVSRTVPFTTYHTPRLTHCSDTRRIQKLPALDCPGDADHCYLTLVARGISSTDLRAHVDLELQMRVASSKPKYTVYWHAVRTTPTRIVLEYWFFYSYNAFANRHEGDWEWIGIDLDMSSSFPSGDLFSMLRGTPVKVYYSTHRKGLWRKWPAMKPDVNRIGNRPIVNVAVGSHANYLNRGTYAAEECVSDSSGPCFGHPDEAHGDKCQLADYQLLELGGAAFGVTYGAANHLGPRNQVTGPGPSDPREKPEFTNPNQSFARALHDTSKGARRSVPFCRPSG